MTDKKTFGSFIRQKRTEKNYSQKDLAEMLFVTEGAVSKWERGVSYPDITLVSDICRVLQISEHELITASTDTDAGKVKQEARKFRIISGAWFLVPTISYIVTLLICFICNLAVNHTLSWFFIVLASLICAYTFVPTVIGFFSSKKLLAFCVSTYLSIVLLLFTCAVYTDGLSWFLTACIGLLIGYAVVFLPILLSKTKLSRFKFLISFLLALVLTILLLLNINLWNPFMIIPAIMVTCYSFIPLVICAFICTLPFDRFLKGGICVAFSTVIYYFIEYVVDILFKASTSSYKIDFNNWGQCLEGNIFFLYLISGMFIGFALIGVGILRVCKKK